MIDPSPPARTPTPDIRDLVFSRFTHSKNTYQTLFLRSGKWYDLYRGWTTGTFQSFRNNVSIPLIFSTVWTDVARKINISFGVWPYVSMFGYGPEDAGIARKNELLISAQLRDTKILAKAADMFLTADLYGTAICQTGWSHKEETLLRRNAEIEPRSGKRIERTLTEKRTMFDGPQFEVIDIVDFFPQPNIRDIEDMAWVIRRYYMDLDELDALSKPVEEGGPGKFDRSAFLELKKASLTREIDRELEVRRNMIRNPFTESDTRRMERYAKPVELIEMWGTVPSEFMQEGMASQRVITLANRKVVMRNQPNPYWHGKKPFISYSPLRDPHFFHGIGKVEVSEKLQLLVNRIANQKLDALDIFLDPVFAYDRQKGVETRNLYMRSGKLIGVDGPPSEAIHQLNPDLRMLQNAYQEIDQAWRWMQTGTGITEGFMTEAGGGNRTTAREFLSRQENVSVRLLLESRFAEEGWVESLADTFRALNKQFLELPREVKILGNNAIINPVTGQPLPPESISLDLDEINMDYDVRARGATQTIGKAARQQNMILLQNALQTNQAALTMINWNAWFRDMFHTFEMGNVDELMTPTPQQQAQMAMLMGGGMPGAPPGTPEPGVGGAPVDLMQLLPQGGEAQAGSLEGTLS